MAWRASVDIPPVAHTNPIPMASRAGKMLLSSGISGRDPATGASPADVDTWCANVFRNLGRVLDQAGAKPADVAHVIATVNHQDVRPVLNKYWIEMFPDEASRPARHTHIEEDASILSVSIQAVCGAQSRRSVDVEGLGHPNPIPMGCRIDNMLFSSGIAGNDRKTKTRPEDPDALIANAFDNVAEVVKAGGAKMTDVGRVEIYLKDESFAPILNKHWLRAFPDENSRPARRIYYGKDHGIGIMMQVVCVVEGV